MGDSSPFYCHVCDQNVNLFHGQFTCPICEDGFVEPSINIGSSPSLEDVLELDATGDSNNVPLQDNWRQSESRSLSPSPPEIADALDMNIPMLQHMISEVYEELQAFMNEMENGVRQTGNPLSAQQKSEIPTILMSNEELVDNPTCPICLDHFKVEDLVRKLSCNHLFHDHCIMPWLHENDTCPICRKCLAESAGGWDDVD